MHILWKERICNEKIKKGAYHGIASTVGFSTATHTIPLSFKWTTKILGSLNSLEIKNIFTFIHETNIDRKQKYVFFLHQAYIDVSRKPHSN